ncbi:MAG: IS110 family transposase [Hyphomicrobiales bacterium]|nr:IS110 family transposase [Hyphomicrobiales bacterium]
MPKFDDLSRSLVALDQDSTLIAVIELSHSSWLVGGMIPGVDREPLKKLAADPEALLRLLYRWRDQAAAKDHAIARICVAYEAGRDGFWLARWLRARDIECHVIHPTSVSVSREHRRAKSDRLDIGLLKRSFLGWLRGEKKHCSMAAVPTREEEDGKRPLRERERLVSEATRLVNRMKGLLALHGIAKFDVRAKTAPRQLRAVLTAEGELLPPNTLAELLRAHERLQQIQAQIDAIETAQRQRLRDHPEAGLHPMILLLARVYGVGLGTAELLVREALSRPLRDRRAVARYAGATGAPDESGSKRREQGLAKAGNARVRRALIQLAWRFLRHQPDNALAKWFRQRTQDGRRTTRKTMIVALARKLLIALWELVTTGLVPAGFRMHAAI